MSAKDLQTRTAEIIDSSWHYNWYWERTEFGNLTLNGWKKALEDGKRLAMRYEKRADDIRMILMEVKEEIKKCEKREKDDG